ncbi:MAG TPA: ABC transporter permease [Vicinamibacterales bacterium]|nr:ABC transporter permease [Vicinamibacterales bacterium]
MNHHLIRDLRVAARSFLRTPRFTIPALLALALGIGSTAAIFSVVRGVMLRPLPYVNPDRIVVVWEHNLARNRARNVIAPSNFVEWRERNRSFTHLGMATSFRLNFMLGGQPEEIVGTMASSDLFPVLGVTPALGRAYGPSEDLEHNDRVIIVSHGFWRTRLGGRTDAIGTTINTNGVPRTLVGVMPEGFTLFGEKTDFLIPYGWTMAGLRETPGRGSSFGLALLRDDVSFAQAESDMKALMALREKENPRLNTGWSITLVPAHEQMVDQIRPALQVLAGAVLFVWLVACVNVANLLLARGAVREREFGLRTALGAGRARIVSQMLAESVLLGLGGGVVGLALAFVFHRGLLALVADRLPVPRLEQVTLDPTIIALTFGLSLLTGLVFGIAPALVASHRLNDTVRAGGRSGSGPRSRRVLGTLVATEVALSLVLLTGAALLVQSFVRLSNVNPGFRAEGLLTARVQVPYESPGRRAGFYVDVVSRIAALPGVQSAAAISFLPLAGGGIGTSFYRADRPEPAPGQAPVSDVRPVTPGFFRTMGIPQVMGRDFTSADRIDSPLVAIVNETLVTRYLDGENPLGKRLNVFLGPPERRVYEIVGVVGDIKLASLDGEVRPTVYVQHTQISIPVMTFVARTQGNPELLVPGVSAAVHGIDPELPVADVRTMDAVVGATLARPRIVAVLLTVFAVMALALAAVGVYGVMAYSVAQRTQEIGVRMALGATADSVLGMVIGDALRLVGIGVAAGLVCAAGLTRLLTTLLYETEPLDPITFLVTAVVLTVVATLASFVPARRGTRIAPIQALRAD